jgi:hypothetical protein
VAAASEASGAAEAVKSSSRDTSSCGRQQEQQWKQPQWQQQEALAQHASDVHRRDRGRPHVSNSSSSSAACVVCRTLCAAADVAVLHTPVCLCLMQEEERERRADFVPEQSAIQTDNIEVRGPLVAAAGVPGQQAAVCSSSAGWRTAGGRIAALTAAEGGDRQQRHPPPYHKLSIIQVNLGSA